MPGYSFCKYTYTWVFAQQHFFWFSCVSSFVCHYAFCRCNYLVFLKHKHLCLDKYFYCIFTHCLCKTLAFLLHLSPNLWSLGTLRSRYSFVDYIKPVLILLPVWPSKLTIFQLGRSMLKRNVFFLILLYAIRMLFFYSIVFHTMLAKNTHFRKNCIALLTALAWTLSVNQDVKELASSSD